MDERTEPAEPAEPIDPTAPVEFTVQRSVDLDADPDEVWRALTDPVELATWFGPVAQLDAIEGGRGRFVDDDGQARTAVVEVVEPNRRLTFRWWSDGDGPAGASVVTFAVSPRPGGAHLIVTEQPLAARASASSRRAWAWRLDLLLLHVAAFARV